VLQAPSGLVPPTHSCVNRLMITLSRQTTTILRFFPIMLLCDRHTPFVISECVALQLRPALATPIQNLNKKNKIPYWFVYRCGYKVGKLLALSSRIKGNKG